MNYRRVLVPGGTYFFTHVTYKRNPIFINEKIVAILRQAFKEVQIGHPFTVVAIVILPDHFHAICSLPENDYDFPTRWRIIKTLFTREIMKLDNLPFEKPGKPKRGQPIWQGRYWERLIGDTEDLNHHIDYIHFNPMKHGLVNSVRVWPFSSLHSFVRKGICASDWGVNEEIVLDKIMEIE